jgi:hypothetical protein
MDILTGALSLLTGGAAGGLFGLVGSLTGAWLKERAIKAEREFTKEKWAYELDLQKLQMQAKVQETEQELAIVSQQGAWQGLDQSVKHDTVLVRASSVWVNDVKSLFRPALTLVLQGGQIWIIWLVATGNETMTQVLIAPSNPVADLLRYAVFSWVFAAQTSVVWWYGDRAFAPPGMKNR